MFFNGTDKRYNQFSQYIKNKVGEKLYKLTLNTGMGCPNRDGTIGHGGCIFCDESGSFSRSYGNIELKNQMIEGIEWLQRRFKAKKFLSYLQSYTNTYADIATLKEIYDTALDHPLVEGIAIGTRPDCIDEEKINLISSYTNDKIVWIEYGLQTIHDETLKYINRGHNAKCFFDAVRMTQNRGIKICAHVILGLPNETKAQMLETVKALADIGIDGVKFHALCVLVDSKIKRAYYNNEFNLLEEDEYVDIVCDCMELLPKSTTIHRLGGNGLKSNLIGPKWLNCKFETLNKIDNTFKERGTYQGYGFIKV